ncbi:MAG: potassium efflux system protein [Hyphomicrobiaceae bacterium]|jgi:potassium efflux system protein
MELRTYVEDCDQHAHLLDDLHTRIGDAFREHGIEIAFPQQDVHLRSARPGASSCNFSPADAG